MDFDPRSPARRHGIAATGVIGLHVVLALGVIAATAVRHSTSIPTRLIGTPVPHDDLPPPEDRPPPERPLRYTIPEVPFDGVPPVVHPQELGVRAAAPAEHPDGPAPAPATPVVTAARVERGLDLGAACQRYYPASARRLQQEGSVLLGLEVGADGRVAAARIERSSGVTALDEAAARCMLREGRFEPQRVDGRAAESWQRLRYTWRLTS